MQQDTPNTFSFNNFKPYGEKMQTFSKKPITLIYGPNSVRKSSFMHVNLYNEYLDSMDYIKKTTSAVLNLKQSNFAGDILDLGGYANFVHQKDLDKEIILSTVLSEKKDIAKILPESYTQFVKLEDEGLSEHIKNLSENLDEIILERINNFKIKEGFFFCTNLHRSLFEIDPNEKSHYEVFQKNNTAYKGDLNEAFEECILSNNALEDTVVKKDNTPFDVLDKAILFLLDNVASTLSFDDNSFDIKTMSMFVYSFNFYKYIAKIQNITLKKILIKPKDEDLYLRNQFFINEELLFELDYRDNKLMYTVYMSCSFWKHYISTIRMSDNWHDEWIGGKYSFNFSYMQKARKEGESIFAGRDSLDSLDKFISLHMLIRRPGFEMVDLIKEMVCLLSKKVFENPISNKVQYIGPLRWIPGRYDLIQSNNYKESPTYSQNLTYEKIRLHNIVKISDLISQLYKGSTAYLKQFKGYLISDFLNPFIKNNKDKISRNGAKTSEKMWMDFIASSEVQDEINIWLSDEDKLKSNYKVEITKVNFKKSIFSRYKLMKKLNFIDIRSNTYVHPMDMGLGISQVLPVLISTKMSKDSKIFLEQPELHLHPKVQAELADEFIRSSKESENNNEFMIETHSEHLLLRIMRRMRHTAEGKIGKDDVLALTPDDVCLLYVDSDDESTYIKELRLSKKGKLLDHWPGGFFEEGYRERFQ